MAASNVSKISKAISKIVPPSVGSPKRDVRPTSSQGAEKVAEHVFKKPSRVPVRSPSKVKKEVKTLSVPSPARRPPSLPLSPWNADHAEVIQKTLKTNTAIGEVKKRLPKSTCGTIQKSINKFERPKGTTPLRATKKSPRFSVATNVEKSEISGDVSVTLTKKKNKTLESSTNKENVKDTSTVTSFKPTILFKPGSPSCATYEDLKEKIDMLQEKLDSTSVKLTSKPSIKVSEEIEKDVPTNKTPIAFRNENKVNAVDDDSHIVSLNKSHGTNTVEIKTQMKRGTGIVPGLRYEAEAEAAPTMQNKLSPYAGILSANEASSPRARTPNTRRSLDSLSSPRSSLPGDRPWSPYGRPLPRVFERQYDNFADAIFAPYITDDENATAMRSPRYSF